MKLKTTKCYESYLMEENQMNLLVNPININIVFYIYLVILLFLFIYYAFIYLLWIQVIVYWLFTSTN